MITTEQSLLDQLHDIYGLYHIPFWQTRFFLAFMLIITALLSLLILWYTLRRWRKRHHVKHPWDKALEQIQALEQSDLLQVNQAKLFYSELTRIIKEYMHDRWDTALVSKTDDEIIAYSYSIDVSEQIRQGVREIFDGVIFIKFAQASAAQERMKRDVAAGKAFVYATIPRKP